MKSVYEIPDLNPEQFERFAQLIHEVASITLKDHKITLLSNRLRRRLHELNLLDYDEYFQLLTDPASTSEMSRFLEVITTNETYFWRTIQNFELIKKDILPRILAKNPGQTISIWSAGCSSGEESYNLAMELTESMKNLGIFEFKIRASDISERMIAFALEGLYHGRKIDKVPENILRRYFRADAEKPGYFRIRDDLKKRIDFHVENLFKAEVGMHHCIVCRNVMIYFNKDDQLELVNKFYDQLYPGGYFIVGHSESLHMFDIDFESVQLPNGIAYYKAG